MAYHPSTTSPQPDWAKKPSELTLRVSAIEYWHLVGLVYVWWSSLLGDQGTVDHALSLVFYCLCVSWKLNNVHGWFKPLFTWQGFVVVIIVVIVLTHKVGYYCSWKNADVLFIFNLS